MARRRAGRAARPIRALAAILIAAGAAGAVPAFGSARAEDLVAAGWEAYRAGALPQAGQAFLAAVEEAPSWATPAVWLAAVLVARGERGEAKAWFQRALARHPTIAEAEYAAGWLARLGVAASRPRRRVGTLEGLTGFVNATNPLLTVDQARWVATALRTASADEGVDMNLLVAVLYVESRFNHQAISTAGALGMGQLMPGTAAGLGVDPRDPWQNVVGAARLLHDDIQEFHSVPLALAAYNAGSGAVRRWGGVPPYPETRWYVWAVLWIRDGLV